jgi:hypothetical protein
MLVYNCAHKANYFLSLSLINTSMSAQSTNLPVHLWKPSKFNAIKSLKRYVSWKV